MKAGEYTFYQGRGRRKEARKEDLVTDYCEESNDARKQKLSEK